MLGQELLPLPNPTYSVFVSMWQMASAVVTGDDEAASGTSSRADHNDDHESGVDLSLPRHSPIDHHRHDYDERVESSTIQRMIGKIINQLTPPPSSSSTSDQNMERVFQSVLALPSMVDDDNDGEGLARTVSVRINCCTRTDAETAAMEWLVCLIYSVFAHQLGSGHVRPLFG